MVDQVKIPFLFQLFGQRRSWALISQIGLVVMLLGLGSCQPERSILTPALWSFGVALCSALQDIVVEAYRIEIIHKDQIGAAASANVLGWRLGVMAAGVGALFLADLFSWQIAYNTMAALMSVGLLTTLCSPSPPKQVSRLTPPFSLETKKSSQHFWNWVSLTYGQAIRELWHKNDWRIVLAFIVFYKIGDTTLNVMHTPFLIELGFSKLEIAHIAKLFGISAMIAGGFLGGVLLSRFGTFRVLILCAALQFFSCLMFIFQAIVGYDFNLLILTSGIENLACGLGAAAFVAYLSSLCSSPNTATHFAVLSSFGSMVRIVLSMGAGILADVLPWPLFFAIAAIACLPCLFLLLQAPRHFAYKA